MLDGLAGGLLLKRCQNARSESAIRTQASVKVLAAVTYIKKLSARFPNLA